MKSFWHSLTQKQRIAFITGLILLVVSYPVYYGVRTYQVNQWLAQAQVAREKLDYTTSLTLSTKAMAFNPEKAKASMTESQSLVDSEQAFQKGLQAEKDKAFLDAEAHYNKVIQQDRKNYDKAQTHKSSVINAWAQETVKQAAQLYQQKQFEKAYQELQKVLQKKPGFAAAKKQQDTYKKAADKQYLERETHTFQKLVQDLSNKNISPAREALSNYIQAKHPATLIQQAKNRLQTLNTQGAAAQSEMEDLRSKDRYSQAIAFLQNSAFIEEETKDRLTSELEAEKKAYLEKVERENKEKDDLALNVAQQVLMDHLKAPGSAEFLEKKVLSHDNYGRRLVFFLVDSQNSFGALVRDGFLVVVRPDLEKQSAYYSRIFAVQKSSREPEEHEMEIVQGLNSWNIDPN